MQKQHIAGVTCMLGQGANVFLGKPKWCKDIAEVMQNHVK